MMVILEKNINQKVYLINVDIRINNVAITENIKQKPKEKTKLIIIPFFVVFA